jgi:group II intron reverse transcriptase/maturase
MSSDQEYRQPNISNESFLKGETVNPSSFREVPSSRRALRRQPPNEATRFLMEQVIQKTNVQKALKRVIANQGAAGVDKMEVTDLPAFLTRSWPRIQTELLAGTYHPQPVKRVEIPKTGGGTRLLGIPTAVDRFIQQAILQVLSPLIDPTFSEASFGFRPGRNAHQAIERARQYIKEGYEVVVDIDLEKFFDRVNHDILMHRLSCRIADKRLLKLIRAYLSAGVMVEGVRMNVEEGTPQGGPLSPLLANILLDDLDQELTRRGHRFVRYADDCNIYVKTERAGQRVMDSVKEFLSKKLKLTVNKEKSAVDHVKKRKFLGFSFLIRKGEVLLTLPRQSKERFKTSIRRLTAGHTGCPLAERIRRLNSYLTGWVAYYHHADTSTFFRDMDSWIRHRLRMCLLKQWKKPATVKRHLLARGIAPIEAAQLSSSRLGYWRLSLSPQMHRAFDNIFWKLNGLVSLLDKYQKLRVSF